MKTYKFMAVTSNSDMIMGLTYPVIFGLPILAVRLGAFYFGVDEFFKSHSLLSILIIFSVLYCSYLSIKKIQQSLIRTYVVELDYDNISILENDREIMSGKVSFCDIHNKQKRTVRSVSVDICTENDKITLRTRSKEYKSITGLTNYNMFGIGDSSDMDTLLSLGKELKNIVGE